MVDQNLSHAKTTKRQNPTVIVFFQGKHPLGHFGSVPDAEAAPAGRLRHGRRHAVTSGLTRDTSERE
ncbi:hypothetical protein GCM10009662_31990 [Catellatospora coxensis]